MKVVAALLGLAAVASALPYPSPIAGPFASPFPAPAPVPSPSCCGLGSSCGSYYGGECCGGLSCGPALTCIAAEYPFPAYGAYGYPYYGYYGGYGYSGPACIGCGCGCDSCYGCGGY